MQNDPSGFELIMIVMNYVTSVPVLVCVGIFRYVHTLAVRRGMTLMLI
jgi:hypothetical protein